MSQKAIHSHLQLLLVLLTGIAMIGCGGAKTTTQDASGDRQKPAQIATGESSYDAPDHRFEARRPEAHPWRWSQPVDHVRQMPPLKYRYDQCFSSARDPKPIARHPHYLKGSGGALQSGQTGSAAPRSAKKEKSRAKANMASGADMAQPSSAPAPSAVAAEAEASPSRIASSDADDAQPIADEERAMRYDDWGAKIYLSNDDTMSLSSAQRVIYAIDKFLPLPADHIRPHELLNYFSFETLDVPQDRDFAIAADIAPNPTEEGIYTLSLAVTGRPVDLNSRRNAALTLVIDRSGSMRDEGRMDYLKRGLKKMIGQLKRGDMLHLVLFDHEVCTPIENFVVGRDDTAQLERVIEALRPRGSTDLHRGLSQGYEIADVSYQKTHSNRVIMITDALANTGVTSQEMIAMIGKYYDSRRIRLSGVGVGRNFNDSLLDRLTERGRGAYVFLGSEAEVDAVFGSRFISLIETTAADVHFRLHLPPSLKMNVFYGEESSTVKEDVQAIHYFANTSQLFLSDLVARGGSLRGQDDLMLTIEYKDPETEKQSFEEYVFNLGRILSEAYNIKKGRLIMTWIDLLAEMATRPRPGSYGRSEGAWVDSDGYYKCEEGSKRLTELMVGLETDPESGRVMELWDKFCSRFERPREPVRRTPQSQPDAWPSAQPKPTR